MYLKKLLENVLKETPYIKKKKKQLISCHVNLTHLGLHILIYGRRTARLIY